MQDIGVLPFLVAAKTQRVEIGIERVWVPDQDASQLFGAAAAHRIAEALDVRGEIAGDEDLLARGGLVSAGQNAVQPICSMPLYLLHGISHKR